MAAKGQNQRVYYLAKKVLQNQIWMHLGGQCPLPQTPWVSIIYNQPLKVEFATPELGHLWRVHLVAHHKPDYLVNKTV